MTRFQRSFIVACLWISVGLLVASWLAGCAHHSVNKCGPEVWDCGEDR